ncbi:MAG TPA: DNA-3-methyladenine glycosylase 2 family protein [Lachnoclostridium sp.]|jgi:DNA-3-methyladenine glycosylase II|uniref:DNA-3-methyladenine glycosylase family protein n=1 Tax=Lacrimispora sp. TaxID=2719234 RepID=UPI000EC749AF|nr:DNA-3-methyladenine glycosylase 2 family protein [Lacrimispora sp.]HCD46973.1 DNA-3-methyladenine glycosylase 2 family protein [Lachnoclostridium sp.]
MPAVETKFFDYSKEEVEYLSHSDPVLGDAMARLGRVEREVIPDPFAALVNAIIGQLISVSSAKTVWNRMQENLGDITPENLSAVSEDDIQRCGMIMKKAAAISELSKDILQGKVCLDDLGKLTDQEVIRYLTTIKGVGLWTAEMLLINCLERPNVVSWGDIAIRRGMEKLYGLPKLTKNQFEVCKSRYSPYGSVASIYLWKISFL